MSNELNIKKLQALRALENQYQFLDTLSECGDSVDNPQYYTSQVNMLYGMRDMFEAVFGYAPYTKAATAAMIEELAI